MTIEADVQELSSRLLAFEPQLGDIVCEPEVGQPGYWAGAPGTCHDSCTGELLLTYRRRRPRGAGAERGHACYIARRREDGRFEDIWSIDKDELQTPSMERFCLRRAHNGRWHLYISYVDPADYRWRIDVLTADRTDAFKPRDAQPVLAADGTGTQGVKDPYLLRVGPAWLMFASYAVTRSLSAREQREAHATADIYTTGLATAPTGLATSLDGVNFDWHGQVLPTGATWDSYQSRLTSVVRAGPATLGFYDGSADAGENYEERCGLALAFDVHQWTRLTPRGPQFQSPAGTGSVRYVDAVGGNGSVSLYYEYARDDGAHDLRRYVIPAV